MVSIVAEAPRVVRLNQGIVADRSFRTPHPGFPAGNYQPSDCLSASIAAAGPAAFASSINQVAS